MPSTTAPIEVGQFDDAPDVDSHQQPIDRPEHAYVDTHDLSTEDVDQWLDSQDEDYEDDIDETYDESRVDDEDWEMAERDFTKQYNRLRQHVAVRTGNVQGISSSIDHKTSVAPLPAVNHPRASTNANPVTKGKPLSNDKNQILNQLAALSKYNSRLARIDAPYVMGVGVNRKGPSAHANIKDKSDRATNEQVLDPRTRLILFKMIGRGLIEEVNGCVSTGKEANVYHAVTSEGSHLALKIYKTSILVFKDRDRYVTGEYRFRRGYSRNPRKMVRLWAEKEMRNLKRLAGAGIRCPNPVEVRENVLVMTFVGDKEGWASPRLKDAELPSDMINSLYCELVCVIRRMYHSCKLVHADLSEYNILFHEGHLWIIDVSQSVEHDHPAAFDFLRNDLKNVEEFFSRLGVRCLGLRRCFEFVTKEKLDDPTQGERSDEEVMTAWLGSNEASDSDHEGSNAKVQNNHETRAQNSAHEDSVFLHSFIPRTLNEVYDPERDVAKLNRGEGQGLIYAETIGLLAPSHPAPAGNEKEVESNGATIRTEDNGNHNGSDNSDNHENLEGSEDWSVSDNDIQASEEGFVKRPPRGHKHEDKEAKKERKKAVKADAKEKRKQKMPKAEKKRIIKKTRS